MVFLVIDMMVVFVLLLHLPERKPRLLGTCLAGLFAVAIPAATTSLEVLLVPHYGPFAMFIAAFLVSALMTGWFAVFFPARRACTTGLLYFLFHGVVGTALAVFTGPIWKIGPPPKRRP